MKSTNNQQDKTTAILLVSQYGIEPCLMGSRYLARAVELYSTGIHKCKDLYKVIADESSVSAATVKRCISYAIGKTSDLYIKLSKTFKTQIHAMNIRNSLVIALFGILFDRSQIH